MAGAGETSCFGGPKSTFRDRGKGIGAAVLRCADFVAGAYFGHGRDVRGALIS